MPGRTVLTAVVTAIVGLCLVATTADAQWYTAGYLGANHTMAATVSIDQPALDTALDFSGVTFEARPFKSPQYYGVRVGRLFGERRRLGVEFEWVHPKAYANTARAVPVTGRNRGTAVDETMRMDTLVQRYAMSHGMNFALVNAVVRVPLSPASAGFVSRVSATARAGAGVMLPHAENTVRGLSTEQYEGAGLGMQVAAGVDVRLVGWLSAIADYKFGHGRPEVTVVDGTGRMSANVHQLAFGLAFGFAR